MAQVIGNPTTISSYHTITTTTAHVVLTFNESRIYLFNVYLDVTYSSTLFSGRSSLDADGIVVDLQIPVESVSLTTKGMSSKPAHGEVYSIQHKVCQ
jgi:hypothetical protein